MAVSARDSKEAISISKDGSSRQLEMIEELCRCAKELDNIAIGIRKAIQTNELQALAQLRASFDAAKDEIVAKVQRLAEYRLETY
jgi:hypothetical protein